MTEDYDEVKIKPVADGLLQFCHLVALAAFMTVILGYLGDRL
jgi:hypothetical protein